MNVSLRSLGLFIPLLALLDGAAARADAIRSWEGASARTAVFGQASSQSGPTASAGGTNTRTITYRGSDRTTEYQITGTGSASAGAAGRHDDLLRVEGHYYVGNPGTTSSFKDDSGLVSATSSWTGDRVIVTPPVGGSTPESVRLEFAVKFAAPADYFDGRWMFGTMQIDANGRPITISSYTDQNGGSGALRATGEFDSLTVSDSSPNEYVGKFHMDLALNAAGVSDPFKLALTSLPGTGLGRNGSFNSDQWAQLALTGVRLPDGVLLSEAGYDVAFASGVLTDPTAVPEPASAACWALAALGSAWLARRRFSRPAIA